MTSEALVPNLILNAKNKTAIEFLAFIIGILLISTLAQVVVTLPWTPVPITGQTLGVSLVALSWGRKRASLITLSYLSLGFIGLPIFAQAKSGFVMGLTMGYLFGMVASSYIVGYLVDRGFTKTFTKTFMVNILGSLIIFTCGVFVLAFYLPTNQLIMAGVLPFIPGDILKNLIATTISKKFKFS